MTVRFDLAFLCFGLGLMFAQAPAPADAHAALIEAENVPAVRLRAVYETGEPMAGAQVLIYAPDTAADVWARGETDEQGRFEFIPDTLPGRWSVQVRQAGHGAMAHVMLGAGDGPAPANTSSQDDWLRRAVMVGLVAWGALGTALFFRRRKVGIDASG